MVRLLVLNLGTYAVAHECIHDAVTRHSTGPSVAAQQYSRRGAALAREALRVRHYWGTVCRSHYHPDAPDLECYCETPGARVPTFDVGSITPSQQQCAAGDVVSDAKKQFLSGLLTEAGGRLSRVLLVDRPSAGLVFGQKVCTAKFNAATKYREGVLCPSQSPYCGGGAWNDYGVGVNATHHTAPGVTDADFLVYVSAVPIHGGATYAWTVTCMSDQRGRPVAAHFNFHPALFDDAAPVGSMLYRQYVGTVMHELAHALGFSASHWQGKAGWFAAHCAARGQSSGCLPTATAAERGAATVMRMVTPQVRSKSRVYSGCSTLSGAELQSPSSSHWAPRVFGDELMAATAGASEPQLSEVTLAYFADTGHYSVDYSLHSAAYTWGKGKGCSFWTEKCNAVAPAAAREPEFCFPADPAVPLWGCDWALHSKSSCGVREHAAALPAEFRYFAQGPAWGGASALRDYCPAFSYNAADDCTDPLDAPAGALTGAMLGESREANSRCFRANLLLKSKGWTIPGQPAVRCLKVTCSPTCESYSLTIVGEGRSDTLQCNGPGAPVYPADWAQHWVDAATGQSAATVECWAVGQVCGAAARSRIAASCVPPPPPPPRAGILERERRYGAALAACELLLVAQRCADGRSRERRASAEAALGLRWEELLPRVAEWFGGESAATMARRQQTWAARRSAAPGDREPRADFLVWLTCGDPEGGDAPFAHVWPPVPTVEPGPIPLGRGDFDRLIEHLTACAGDVGEMHEELRRSDAALFAFSEWTRLFGEAAIPHLDLTRWMEKAASYHMRFARFSRRAEQQQLGGGAWGGPGCAEKATPRESCLVLQQGDAARLAGVAGGDTVDEHGFARLVLRKTQGCTGREFDLCMRALERALEGAAGSSTFSPEAGSLRAAQQLALANGRIIVLHGLRNPFSPDDAVEELAEEARAPLICCRVHHSQSAEEAAESLRTAMAQGLWIHIVVPDGKWAQEFLRTVAQLVQLTTAIHSGFLCWLTLKDCALFQAPQLLRFRGVGVDMGILAEEEAQSGRRRHSLAVTHFAAPARSLEELLPGARTRYVHIAAP
eukprot:TRINITY_DN21323_c0_g1_i1.p1 TRINITY_DN21323_c0_g1~~TRINITY_DN21323_c0_g1_i1.p1  ORF type:complete len:1068 (+),score=279.06 TRINITY_DN21323_c0_g1_i1:140-3343(+)